MRTVIEKQTHGEGLQDMQQHKLRILFNSNAPFSTSGYGSQMFHLLPALRDAGYDVAQVCFYGLEGGNIQLEGIKLYPRIGSVWGDDAMVEHAKDFKADIVISFQDQWVLNPQLLAQIPRYVPYVPIDHDPVPQGVVDRIRGSYRILTHSKFGKEQLAKKGLYSTMIPLLADTNTLKPYPKADIRKSLGIPEDVFLFGMVAANKDNPPRKSFQEVMDAFKLFHEAHPKSAIYFHTMVAQAGGFPIVDYAKELGIADAVYHMPPYDLLFKVDREGMAKIYSMFDCLLSPSTNEGFGVPIIEAGACGVPVIVNDFTAMPELVIPGVTGEVCKVAYRRYTPLNSYVGIPDTQDLYEKMEKIFNNYASYEGNCRKHIEDNYSLEAVMPKWFSFLEKIEREIYPEPVDNSKEKK